MANIGKTIQKYFYKLRDWYDPEIVCVTKPSQIDSVYHFYPVYRFTVHYTGGKIVPFVIDSNEASSWAGGTPESKIQNLYEYYVKKMQKQQLTRRR